MLMEGEMNDVLCLKYSRVYSMMNSAVKQWNDVEELSVWLLSDERCDGPIRTFLDAAFAVRLALTGTPAKALQ